ncbi:hypothetical protein CDD80_6123 [Ophiocordyceps camponoti-rufipedis]|uniref:Uncharacterized protein n=1 Tax=Ophiocordyceps camponoti-rufipedis TaxID=2004952 RepID=A0A2C5XWM2_9HYPO|nr:hypothetical protein CDD80_6123 [Ophiocordyceps camponoti-rufipedis]
MLDTGSVAHPHSSAPALESLVMESAERATLYSQERAEGGAVSPVFRQRGGSALPPPRPEGHAVPGNNEEKRWEDYAHFL